MRVVTLVGCVVLLVSCERATAPVAPPVAAEELFPIEWTTASHSGSATVTSRREGIQCRLTCERGAEVVWAREECLAQRVDHRFVSDDCVTFVSLLDAPQVDPQLSRTRVGASYGATDAGVPLRLGRLVGTSRVKVSDSGRWVAWLSGTMGNPGKKPRSLPDGTGLEFETLDGVRHTLTFAELAKWVDSPAVDAGPPREGLYQWVDAEGSIQVGAWAQIPPRARAKASRIEAEVSVIEGAAPPRPRSSDRAPLSVPPPAVPSCAAGHARVKALEAELATPPPALEPCAQYVGIGPIDRQTGRQAVGGNPIMHSRCVTANERLQSKHEARIASARAQLEVVRDELRRMQIGGCR